VSTSSPTEPYQIIELGDRVRYEELSQEDYRTIASDFFDALQEARPILQEYRTQIAYIDFVRENFTIGSFFYTSDDELVLHVKNAVIGHVEGMPLVWGLLRSLNVPREIYNDLKQRAQEDLNEINAYRLMLPRI
jgi:hypothetical protein